MHWEATQIKSVLSEKKKKKKAKQRTHNANELNGDSGRESYVIFMVGSLAEEVGFKIEYNLNTQ